MTTTLNVPLYGSNYTSKNAHFSTLKVSQASPPSLRVKVSPGVAWFDTHMVEWGGFQPSSSMIVPSITGQSVWYVVCLHDNGTLQLLSGTPTTSDPELPEIPVNYLPLALVLLDHDDTVITNDMIYDIRTVFSTSAFTRLHANLEDITGVNSHPISAITDLQSSLDDKVDTSVYDADQLNKADIDGTINETFTLNKDYTGAAAPNCALMVERGSEDNVGIRWEESLQQWELTTDGTIWVPINVGGGGAGYEYIQDKNNFTLPQQTIVKFAGDSVSIADDPGNTRTVVTISNGSAGHVIADEGTSLDEEPILDFVGDGVTVTDDPGVKTVVTIPRTAHTIEDHGTPVTNRANLNFLGAGVSVNDVDPDTQVTIPGPSNVKRITATGTTTITDVDAYIIAVDTTGGAAAITIGSAIEALGTDASPKVIIVKDEGGNATSLNITVDLQSGGTIDGQATATITGNYDSLTLYIASTNAFII